LTDLSVSIVNTNSRELLLACLDTLPREAAEIVVLDNASEEGSADAVRERFPDVRVLAQDFRAGFGANHNTVIRATEGRYVYVLNEDTTAGDWAFDRIVAYLDAHPRVAALGPRIVYPDGRLQDSAWRFPTPLVSALGLLTVGKLGVKQSGGERARAVPWVWGARFWLRRGCCGARRWTKSASSTRSSSSIPRRSTCSSGSGRRAGRCTTSRTRRSSTTSRSSAPRSRSAASTRCGGAGTATGTSTTAPS